MTQPPLLEVCDLSAELPGPEQPRPVIDGVSFRVEAGETVGLVGESGCGKTMTALSLLRLLPPAVRITSGRINFKGADLLGLDEPSLRRLRGDRLAMVFQEPMSALNPVLRVGEQIAETLRAHGRGRSEARAQTLQLLSQVGVVPVAERYRAYPHQLSGGLRQRVLIAMGIACGPDLLVADEPTTALDPTLQAQVLQLLEEVRQSSGLALLLISHDLGVVARTCQRLLVLQAGQVVEEGTTAALFQSPRHPYTAALLEAARVLRGRPGQRLPELPAGPAATTGCRFAPRCSRAEADCRGPEPIRLDGPADQRYRCLHPCGGSSA